MRGTFYLGQVCLDMGTIPQPTSTHLKTGLQDAHPLWLCMVNRESSCSQSMLQGNSLLSMYLIQTEEGNVISSPVFLKVPFFNGDTKAKSWLLVINKKNPILNILQGESSYPKGNNSYRQDNGSKGYIFLWVEVSASLYWLYFSLNYC